MQSKIVDFEIVDIFYLTRTSVSFIPCCSYRAALSVLEQQMSEEGFDSFWSGRAQVPGLWLIARRGIGWRIIFRPIKVIVDSFERR